MVNFSQLGNKLPDESVVWGGFGLPLTVNANRVTGDAVTPETFIGETMAKLLEAAWQAQKELNQQRELAGLPPVDVVRRSVVVEDENPIFIYSLVARVDPSAALNNLLDPTAGGS